MTIRDDAAKAKRGPFGLIVDRLLPPGAKVSQLQRAVDVTGPHFYGVLSGERDGKPSRPSPELVKKFIDGLIALGADVSPRDAEHMMEFATTNLPEGWKATKDDNEVPLESWTDYPQELQDALAYAGELTPEARHFVYQLWREQAKAHADIEGLRREAERELSARQQELDRIKTGRN